MNNIFWKAPFSDQIQQNLVSEENPQGTINNSELELAGTIANNAILLTSLPTKHPSTLASCDNIAAVSWHVHG